MTQGNDTTIITRNSKLCELFIEEGTIGTDPRLSETGITTTTEVMKGIIYCDQRENGIFKVKVPPSGTAPEFKLVYEFGGCWWDISCCTTYSDTVSTTAQRLGL